MIFQKLRSQAGASLIAALFLTLFCAMVGTVLLTAASANAGRLSKRNEYDQGYYKVMSAAKLFADEIRGSQVKVVLTRIDNNYGNTDGTTDYQYSAAELTSQSSDAYPTSSEILAFLKESVKKIYKLETVSEEEIEKYWYNDFSAIVNDDSGAKDITIKITDSHTSDPDLLAAFGKCEIAGRIALQGWNCVLKAMFSTKIGVTDSGGIVHSDEIPRDAYFVQMTCVPKVEPDYSSDAEHPEIEQKTITFTWDDVQIMEGR